MANHKLLRLSATLLFIGLVVFGVTIPLHPPGANDHQAAFTAYANSSSWAAIHLGQFVGTAVIIAGLLVLFFALNVSEGTPRWLGFFGAISAGVALALAGRGGPQAGGGCVGKRTGGGAGSTLCQCGSPPVAGVGDNKLSGLHVGSRAGAVRDRDRVDGKSPQAGRLPDGIVGPGLARTGLGDRCRGLRAHR